MKTTLEIPTDLYRRAKIKAATEGRRMRDLVSEGLALVVRGGDGASVASEPATAYAAMRDACGCMASGVSDLGTNPKHLEAFGRV